MLGISEKTLHRAILRKQFPAGRRVGNSTFWTESAVSEFINAAGANKRLA